ncbi:hypothetical protein ABS735_28635 [Streptomyces sp. MMCC 100]|uniref:hypothetical protein n=1 Tax=Streptomyces sp. MMCC 100 TaxID=3163555 RepID=UPI003594DAA4
MTDHKKRTPVDGSKLYRELIGPLSSDTVADALADVDLDNRGNRMWLERLATQGGERGRAARARLDEWTAAHADDNRDPLNDRQFSSGRRRGTDPFDGPPAA